MIMQLQIISINALIISLLIDVRRSSNQKSFNVKFHSIQSFHNIHTTVRTSNLSDKFSSQTKNAFLNPFDLDDLDSTVLLQSKKCSGAEIQDKIQCFEDLPQDFYEVLQNSSLIIKCIVLNQHGKVQWRAQNVVLGYDRSVPGMERLNIVGDVSKGEHNLQITNIQPEDSGEYECQVQPVLKHPLLRKKAQVSVQMLPTTPIILHRHRKLVDHTLIISPIGIASQPTEPKLILECQTDAGSSNVHFIWYWNRHVVSEASQPEVVISSLSHNSSQIELRTDQLKSNDKIQCRVENKASRMVRKQLKTYTELSVTVTVLFYSFTGEPKILNASYYSKRVFEDNEKLSAICKVSPIGSPTPEVKWFWHYHKISLNQFDHQNVDVLRGDSAEIKSHRVTLDSFKDELTTKIHGIRLSKWYHAANLSCVVNQLFLKIKHSTSLRIMVKHPPSLLKIYLSNKRRILTKTSWEEYISYFTSLKINSSIDLIEGRFYRFACSTNLHYTNLNINWSLAKTNKEQYSLENSRQSETVVETYFKQTNSYIELKANKDIMNMDLICTAWPIDSTIRSTSLRIQIFYSPDKPLLTGYNQEESINEYETVNLLCTTKGGNPAPDLVWYKENSTLSNAEPVVSNEDKILSLLSFKVSREDNGKLINCAARNIATSNFGIPSNSIKIRAVFPARQVKIKPLPYHLKQIMANSVIILTCETGSSNPASDIQWWIIHCTFDDKKRIVKRQVPCSKSKLKEIHREIASGKYGGWKTISKLKYSVKWKDNKNFIECESRLPNSEKTTSSLHYDRLRLNVIFAPHFGSELKNGSVFQAQENFKLVIHLKVLANPMPDQYSWFKGDQMLEQNSSFHFQDDILTISKVMRSHRGNYSLKTKNEVGTNIITFYVDVTYPSLINGSNMSDIYVKEDEYISVDCNVSSNPSSTKYLKWRILHPVDILSPIELLEQWHPVYNHSCNENQSTPGRLYNQSWQPIFEINCTTPRKFSVVSIIQLNDSAQVYNAILQCVYDNQIFPFVTKSFIFHIYSPPQYQKLVQHTFQGVKDGEAATFTCIFKGYPIKMVEWHNCTSPDQKYMGPINNSLTNMTLLSGSTDVYQIQPNLYRAQKTIRHHDWKMLNRICCQAKNSYGTDFGIITILPKSVPNAPETFRILDTLSNYFIIKWDQNYNGGSEQDFIIKVKRKDAVDEDIQFNVPGNPHRISLFFNISGLLCGTCYVIQVGAFNKLFADVSFAAPVEACTLPDSNFPSKHRLEANIKQNISNIIPIIPKVNHESVQKSTSFIVTVAGCVFGFIIFIINVLTFIICYKKKRETVRKRRQSKDIQSTDERQTENMSKLESSMLENHLYEASILAPSDSCYPTDHRNKEEEIPMLVYQKPICPLHFVSNDQFSNPLIIQDHYLQPSDSCSQTSNKKTSCYGCPSIELPLNSMILSNQYLPFGLLESTYNSLMRTSCEYSLAPNINPPKCSEYKGLNEDLSKDSKRFQNEILSSKLSNIMLNPQSIHLSTSSINQKEDSYQSLFRKQSSTATMDDKQSVMSPIIHRGFFKNPGSN